LFGRQWEATGDTEEESEGPVTDPEELKDHVPGCCARTAYAFEKWDTWMKSDKNLKKQGVNMKSIGFKSWSPRK